MSRVRAFLVAVCFAMFAVPAMAQTIDWHFRSEHPNVVSVELYSEDRSHIWPGNNEVYTLDTNSVRTISISCRRGEKICYGAWVRNTRSATWGAGPDGKKPCNSCCFTCNGGETPELVLE